MTESALPVEGSDAGPADEYRAQRKLEAITSTHGRAADLYAKAKSAAASFPEEAEGYVREALEVAAEAYWYAENTDGALAEHQYLHEIGRWTCKTFKCEFVWEGATYRTYCPVKIADKRFGVSPGFVARRWCSVCDGDLSECPHRRDRLYWVAGGPTESGPCRVCREESCDHDPGTLYPAPVIGVIKSFDELTEVSFVDVPANPLARAAFLEVHTDDLSRAVHAAFPDVPAFCDHCVSPYHGLPENLNIAGLAEEEPPQTTT